MDFVHGIPFDTLPLHPEDPPHSAWGLFGGDDQLGRINLLTPDVTRKAANEIKTGETIPLNLPLDVPVRPMNPVRRKLNHTIIPKGKSNDDEIVMNTQSSTHWDGLRHYPYQDTLSYYNRATQEDISGEHSNSRIGVQNIANHAIATRGILLDYVEYANARNISYSSFTSHEIPHTVLQGIADSHGIVFRAGDILLVRSGFNLEYNMLSQAEKDHLGLRTGSDRKFAGARGTVEAVTPWPTRRGRYSSQDGGCPSASRLISKRSQSGARNRDGIPSS